MPDFGDYLKELRGKRSLREMEKVTGLSHTYLSSLEKGYDPRSKKERKPTPETLRKLSNTLDVPYDHLMQKAGYIDELPIYDWFLNEDHSSLLMPVTVQIPSRISMRNPGGSTTTRNLKHGEDIRTWLFDLRYLLNLQVELQYGGKILSDEQKVAIEKFIREMIRRKE